MNKYELAKKINELDGLTNEEKSELLKLLRAQKKYGLVWEDKPEDAELRMTDKMPVLEEVAERAIISDDTEAPNHILIEGDNLEALTALTYTHQGKIDVIYIDPPYNTGNKDFSYNDTFIDRENGYRHSMWLSFMNKRLKITKNLLSDNGVIFISIDDNEHAQLKLLCDEIFGIQNFCGELIWRKKNGGGQTDIYFVTEHEYILVYQKTSLFKWTDPREPQSLEEFKYEDTRGRYNLVKLEKWGSSAHREDRPSMYFPIIDNNGNEFYPVAPDGKAGRWRVGFHRMENILRNGLIEWRKGKPYEKIYFDLTTQKQKIKKSRSILYDVAENADGSYLLTALFGKKDVFINPKPMELVRTLLTHHGSKNSTILDFFAGSGTTLHATMQLNAEDGGHRQCILATNNENGICENVTYERNRRVIKGYTTPKGEEVPGLTHNNLRYYKTQLLPRKQSVKNKRTLVSASTDLLCIKNDVYTEQTHFAGKKLKTACARYFDNGKTKMLVIYNELTVNAFAETIGHMDVEGKILIYVFSNTRYAYDDDFEEVLDKVELCALPAAIYDAYRNILPEEKPTFEEPLEAEEHTESKGDESQNNNVANEGLLSFDFQSE